MSLWRDWQYRYPSELSFINDGFEKAILAGREAYWQVVDEHGPGGAQSGSQRRLWCGRSLLESWIGPS